MNIMLGNVSISEFIKRTGYQMSEEDIKILEKHRQDNAKIDIQSDKFHIFDIPFCIVVAPAYKKELIKLITKYEEISATKESFSINEEIESDAEKAKRVERDREQLEREKQLKNPNSIWLIKWHMAVPVVIEGKDAYYWCFVNTYTKGRENIPDIIDGRANIRLDEEGLHGRFELFNPEKDNDSELFPEHNYVVGCGFLKKSGQYVGSVRDVYFDNVEFSIKEAIQNYIDFRENPKEIHFDRIAN